MEDAERGQSRRLARGGQRASWVPDMPNADDLVRELNQRVKNNFQIIVSLMNLKQRTLPPAQREDIRFLQEHVQCMAVAYRLIYATGEMIEVPLAALLREVISELRRMTKLRPSQIRESFDDIPATMGLDQATALSLYLAVVLPPYIDRALLGGDHVSVAVAAEDGMLALSVSGDWSGPVEPDRLRVRLRNSYLAQLQAEADPGSDPAETRCRFPVDPRPRQ